MDIYIKTISHNEQRYNTVGDYWMDEKGVVQIRISEMGNDDYEFLVLDHEIQEIYLCLKRGITFKDIDKFDAKFERDREAGIHDEDDEPGDDRLAPYFDEHQFASLVERMASYELKVDFEEYGKRVVELTNSYRK
ncbi:MAG: hypothetical protein PHW52_02805 [Candidatus Pacebacteria bacterium]|nr:hypothetical protein [Candidatus Paceibacterota bacterium]